MDWQDVLKQELDEIGARRSAADPDRAPGAAEADGLVGVCLSGGGIRSATFNLGMLRGLRRWGLFGLVDYLSTVSGGGYTGSCVADHLRRGQGDALLGEGDPAAIKRLRGRGRFLTPNGRLGEWLQGFAALGRGLITNFLALALVAALLAALLAMGLTTEGQWKLEIPQGVPTLLGVGLVVLVLFLSVFLTPLASEAVLVAIVALAALGLLIDLTPFLLGKVEGEGAALAGSAALTAVGGAISRGVLAQVPAVLVPTLARLSGLLLAVILPSLVFLSLLALLDGRPPLELLSVAGAMVLALGILYLLTDVNVTSLHGFYRDRIGQTYLGIDPKPPRLSAFRGKPGPLHLVNVALNTPDEGELSLRDRQSDFFSMSCLHAGGPRTGWSPIHRLEQSVPSFTAASAVAISGAAAAPNMGSYTDDLLRPIMTLLNIRMGYWAPSPKTLQQGKARVLRPRLWHLLREARGRIDSQGRLVNISDGGHLENLGAFELLRRKCRLIIIGDGEADPAVSMGAMATLIRFAQIDLGAQIDIDLDDLRVDAQGMSRKHGAVGRVTYADGSVGHILYMKSSLVGDEPPDVRYYKDEHPDFPHESTADQWFDDAQFDAYLRLGEEVVDWMFQALGFREPSALEITRENMGQRMAELRVVLAPTTRARAVVLTEQLDRLQSALAKPEYAAYRSQLVPTIHREPVADVDLKNLTPIVMRQLQLMENAVEYLGLVDARNRTRLSNRGWMNLFSRWAASDAFQKMALVLLPSFSSALSHFGSVALGLGTGLAWENAGWSGEDERLALKERNPHSKATGRGVFCGRARVRTQGKALLVLRVVLRGGFDGEDRLVAAMAALRVHAQSRGLHLDLAAVPSLAGLPPGAWLAQPAGRAWTAEDEAWTVGLTASSVGALDFTGGDGDLIDDGGDASDLVDPGNLGLPSEP